jgi:hypothetical protein
VSAEVVALLVLAGGAVAAVAFTVVVVDRSDANPRSEDAGEKEEERETESG